MGTPFVPTRQFHQQARGHFVPTLQRLRDEPDNRILVCALTAHAKLIVTGDRAMSELGEYKGIRIVTLRAFLGTIG